MLGLAFQAISTRPLPVKASRVGQWANVRLLVLSTVQRRVVSTVQRAHPEHTTAQNLAGLVPMASSQAAHPQQRAPKRNVLQRSVNMPGHPPRRAPKVEGIVQHQQLTLHLPVRRAAQPNSMAGLRNTNTTSGSRLFR
jgi:hypothetical protein